MQMTKDDWVVVTTCIGSAFTLHVGDVPDEVRRFGMNLAAISQRLPDKVWNAAADNSEGLMQRTDVKPLPGCRVERPTARLWIDQTPEGFVAGIEVAATEWKSDPCPTAVAAAACAVVQLGNLLGSRKPE